MLQSYRISYDPTPGTCGITCSLSVLAESPEAAIAQAMDLLNNLESPDPQDATERVVREHHVKFYVHQVLANPNHFQVMDVQYPTGEELEFYARYYPHINPHDHAL